MLQSKCIYGEDNWKKDFLVRRYEEIIQYKDPLKAMVQRTLEIYIEEAFNEFIDGNIGKTII